MYSAHPSQSGLTAGHIPRVTIMFPEETTTVSDTLGACLLQYQATVLGPFAPLPMIFLQNWQLSQEPYAGAFMKCPYPLVGMSAAVTRIRSVTINTLIVIDKTLPAMPFVRPSANCSIAVPSASPPED